MHSCVRDDQGSQNRKSHKNRTLPDEEEKEIEIVKGPDRLLFLLRLTGLLFFNAQVCNGSVDGAVGLRLTFLRFVLDLCDPDLIV